MDGGLSRERILVVDDEPQILVALEDLLSDEFTVLTSPSPEDALKHFEHDPNIAVVITDQRMPHMTGDELLARMSGAPVVGIMVTGFADLPAVIRAINEGKVFAYVTKPWNAEDLRFKVAKGVEHFKLARQIEWERQLLTDLMNNTPDGVYFKNRDLQFQRINRSFAQVLGESEPAAAIGKRLSDGLLPQQLAQAIEAEERQLLDVGRPVVDVVREYQQPNGASEWYSESKAPIRGPEGRVEGLVAISRNVTQKRALEQQLVQSQKMEAVGQLAGGVAHDFNNLLAVIEGCGEMALDELVGHPAREDVVDMVTAAKRASSLTRQLLAFSRREAARPEPVRLASVVEGVEKMLRRLIGEHITLLTRLADVPAVLADVNQLEQVLINLCVNARDAMPDGGTLTIELRTAARDDVSSQTSPPAVLLSVSDTGTGMDPEVQKRIFEPFFTTKEIGKGTGLGLSMVYGIVAQNGGQVAVESSLGRGSTFTLAFPVTSMDQAQAPSTPRPKPQSSQSGTILLVEDDPSVRHITARILRRSGYVVLEAGKPSEARAISQAGEAIDLLLADLVMPEMSGMKLGDELSLARPGLRVLYMTGYVGSSLNAERVALLDPDGRIVQKPFTADDLLERVRAALLSPTPAA